MILAALAAAAGIGRALFGIRGAQKQGLSERDQIKRAYQITKRRTNEAQAYTRQQVNESLNARGILNGGANPGRSSVLQDAYAAGEKSTATTTAIGTAKGIGRKLKAMKAGGGAAGRAYGTEQERMAADSERGQSGAGDTLSGQVNSDLSREFYGEQQDLYSQRQQGINASKRGQSAATVNAIGSGIDVGTSVYQAGSMIKGAFGSQAATPKAPGAGEPGYQPPIVKQSPYFAGLDPVDPLGLNRKTTNDLFNVNSKP